MTLEEPFRLPCGKVIANRIAGAALTEHLAGEDGLPNENHFRLYELWGRSGAAFKLTGNVMVDGNCLEGNGNVVLDRQQHLLPFETWAQSGSNGTQCWMQLGHAGGLSVSSFPISPSGIRHCGARRYAQSRSMSQSDIRRVVTQFAYAAGVAKKTGFAGIEIHSAHGFLLAQFLSRNTNQRADAFGGSLRNRMRLLTEILESVRDAVGDNFPLAVKLDVTDGRPRANSGWETEEALVVAAEIAQNIDVLEISGGSYDAPVMLNMADRRQGFHIDEFRSFACQISRVAPSLPVMLTGGIRVTSTMESMLRDGVSIIGLGRPLITIPDVPRQILQGNLSTIPPAGSEALPVFQQLQWFQQRLHSLAKLPGP